MLSSPHRSTSSMSHALRISSSVMLKPILRISLMTNSFFIMVRNSSLSRNPLPSASALMKASRKKSMKALACCSAWRISCSFRSTVAATMYSEATAVSTEIIVQETKVIKPTKKRVQAGFKEMSGLAMSIQPSCVLTRKSVKSDVGTSWKHSLTAAHSSSRSQLPPSFPSSRVSTMAQHSRNMIRSVKIQTTAVNTPTRACAKARSLGKSFTALNMRRSRSTRTKRNTRAPVLLTVTCVDTSAGSIHESRMPMTTMMTSRTVQQVSLAKKATTPLCTSRSRISAKNTVRKKLSKKAQTTKSG
mmetsp:Transcript_44726/g.127663  ORF Transcript_44726/g.127663 Transcript_44726/m.127663 type:complete len:302 (+) Transcript_44726:339-1244(+)